MDCQASVHLIPRPLNPLCDFESRRLNSLWVVDHECNAFLYQVLFKGFLHPFIQHLQHGSVPHWDEVNFNADLLQS
jgi:hypothetical protein